MVDKVEDESNVKNVLGGKSRALAGGNDGLVPLPDQKEWLLVLRLSEGNDWGRSGVGNVAGGNVKA